MTFRLRTFGGVCLERDGIPLGGTHSQRRRLAALAYLAAQDRGLTTRQKLIALLWPEADEAGGRHSLSQLLYALRHDLGSEALTITHETIALNQSLLGSDVHDFDAALRSGDLERAVEEYRGPFLDGFHIDGAPEMERWIETERGRRAGRNAQALERLAVAAEKQGDLHRAHELWRRLAAVDPTDGRVTLRLMRSHIAIGDRRGALRAATVYSTLVREELEAEPDRAVMELVAAVRDDGGPLVQASFSVPAAADAPARARAAAEDVALSAAPPPVTPTQMTPTPEHHAKRRRAWQLRASAATAAVLLTSLAWLQSAPSRTGPALPGTPAVVVLGDLGGPDSVLSLAVREALRAQLSNTKGVIVTSDLGIRELKALMRLPQDSALGVPQLLAIATRHGAHIAIAGSVVPIGTGAQIVVDVIDPASGQVKRTFSERPADAPTILAAVGRLSRAVGTLISQGPRDPDVRALPAVTTASLPALKSYALARQKSARGLRVEALEHGEHAVFHDSTFVLAHYLVADLLWFLDEQSRSDAHLTKAYELRETVPLREQLVIRARYEQLVRDRPDSALAYWDMLRSASPRDVLAYEGRTWALRALGRHKEAAAAADTAMSLDPAAVVPNTNNALYSFLALGDTTSALLFATRVTDRNPEAGLEARFHAALARKDFQAALTVADSSAILSSRAWRRQLAYLARGDIERARANLDSLRAENHAQFLPRALINEGWCELSFFGDRAAARSYAREALAWLQRRDLSPPAVARLSERIADLAARAGDEATVREVAELVRERDRGRHLRSYVLARRTLDASLAFVRGDFTAAARGAKAARDGSYFWRSLMTIVQLEADARRAGGDMAVADSLKRLVATHQIIDGDFETSSLLLAAGSRPRIR